MENRAVKNAIQNIYSRLKTNSQFYVVLAKLIVFLISCKTVKLSNVFNIINVTPVRARSRLRNVARYLLCETDRRKTTKSASVSNHYGIRGSSATFVFIFICVSILISAFHFCLHFCFYWHLHFKYTLSCHALAVLVLSFISFLSSLTISTFVLILIFFYFDFFVTSKSKWRAKLHYV